MSVGLSVLSDVEIRDALRRRLENEEGNSPDSRIIEELGLCRGLIRVDVAVVNGELHGYEIKSDRDSFRRLAGQIEVYGRVFDRATLVVSKRHLHRAREVLPRWWGLLLCTPCRTGGGLRLIRIRKGRKNSRVVPRTLVELLWLDHAIEFLERHDAARGVRGKGRYEVWDRICEKISANEIAEEVRKHLKATAAIRGSARR